MIGDMSQLNIQIDVFNSYVSHLIESCQLACSMSEDVKGIQMVEVAVKPIQMLLPQVICSARLLCSFPLSSDVNKNMMAFRDTWLNEIQLLLLAVDDILSINEFLAVSENLILSDTRMALQALQNVEHARFKYFTEQISSRVIRVSEIVTYEMNNYETCIFTENIIEICQLLRNKLVPNFSRSAEYAYEALISQPLRDPNENECIECLRLIYDGIRDIRNEMGYEDPEEETNDNLEVRDDQKDLDSISQEPSQPPTLVPPPLAETPIIENISEEQREQINQQLDSFIKEKTNFDREVLKWDDKSNDIVVLAKKMCVIMMKMTDFMRGRGPFTTISDIIYSAKEISALGINLEKLVKELADECPESKSKQELLGYLNQLPLFCNQLNIASKVKEYIIDVNIMKLFI